MVLAYIVKYPEKAERFVKYTAIQEDKMLNAALKVVTQEQLDEIVGLEAVREIRREQFKSEFQVTICKTCKTKGPAPSWDIDLASMARDVGEPYDQIYLFSYLIPNLHVHATLASIVRESDAEVESEKLDQNMWVTLLNATAILIAVIRSQNEFFKLGLEEEIALCDKELLNLATIY